MPEEEWNACRQADETRTFRETARCRSAGFAAKVPLPSHPIVELIAWLLQAVSMHGEYRPVGLAPEHERPPRTRRRRSPWIDGQSIKAIAPCTWRVLFAHTENGVDSRKYGVPIGG